jgi:hypothetical protein
VTDDGVEDRLEVARRQRRVLELQLVSETNRRHAVEAELRRVEGLLRAALDLIEPEHVGKLGMGVGGSGTGVPGQGS